MKRLFTLLTVLFVLFLVGCDTAKQNQHEETADFTLFSLAWGTDWETAQNSEFLQNASFDVTENGPRQLVKIEGLDYLGVPLEMTGLAFDIGENAETNGLHSVFLQFNEENEATLLGKLKFTAYNALDFVQLVWFSLAQLVNGEAGMQDLSGPVGIVSTITEVGEQAETARAAWSQIFYFASLIAINLAVMNLLPIPALDGGRVFFLLVDAVCLLLFKKKVPEKYQAWVNTAGFALLMVFMLMITFNDVFRLFR